MVLLRNILIILFVVFSQILNATKYYVSTTGNDGTGDGSISTPWASLYKATSSVTGSGDTIYFVSGTYLETNGSALSVNVSIDGDGEENVTIKANTTISTILLLQSSAGTNGNQTISNITIDGDSLATFGVRVIGRSNVDIHDFTIQHTIRYGVTYADAASRDVDEAPTTWATGNSMYNLTVIDCGEDSWYSGGGYWQADAAIDLSGQDGFNFYNFNIDNQSGGRYAYGIKGLYGGGYHKGLKIHDGIIRTNIRDNIGEQSFGFNIELWTGVGGVEIYNIDGNGAIDIGGYGWWDDYSYGYACSIHDNVLIQDSRPTNQGEAGLILESGSEDGSYFYRNWVENFSTGMTIGTTAASLIQGFDSVVVDYNVFCNLGYTSGGNGAGVYGYNMSTGVLLIKIYILNNVIHKVNSTGGHGISFEYSTANSWSNTYIDNNIIYNTYTPVQFRYQTINDIYIRNNVIYGNTREIINSTSWEYSSWTIRSVTDNQESVDPLFTSVGTDFSLQSSSPCIDTGIDVGLLSDYLENVIPSGTGYDIGAYEYQFTPSYYGIKFKSSGTVFLKSGSGFLK